jgi:hypothetical protein
MMGIVGGVLTGDTARRRSGPSIEPTRTSVRAHSLCAGSVAAGVQGALPPHRYSEQEITESFVSFPGFEAFGDIVRKLHASSKVNSRYLVRPLEDYPGFRSPAMRASTMSRIDNVSNVEASADTLIAASSSSFSSRLPVTSTFPDQVLAQRV